MDKPGFTVYCILISIDGLTANTKLHFWQGQGFRSGRFKVKKTQITFLSPGRVEDLCVCVFGWGGSELPVFKDI